MRGFFAKALIAEEQGNTAEAEKFLGKAIAAEEEHIRKNS